MRFAVKKISLVVLLAGLVLRALTPLGYMPAALGSGLLYELCPEQLPPGFAYQATIASAHQHHGNPDDVQQIAEPDQCQIGHLLFSAVAVDQAVAPLNAAPDVTGPAFLPNQTFPHLTVTAFQPRGPPNLRNEKIAI